MEKQLPRLEGQGKYVGLAYTDYLVIDFRVTPTDYLVIDFRVTPTDYLVIDFRVTPTDYLVIDSE